MFQLYHLNLYNTRPHHPHNVQFSTMNATTRGYDAYSREEGEWVSIYVWCAPCYWSICGEMQEMGDRTDDIIGTRSIDQMDVNQEVSSSRILKTDHTELVWIMQGEPISEDEAHTHTWLPISKYNAVGKRYAQDNPWDLMRAEVKTIRELKAEIETLKKMKISSWGCRRR